MAAHVSRVGGAAMMVLRIGPRRRGCQGGARGVGEGGGTARGARPRGVLGCEDGDAAAGAGFFSTGAALIVRTTSGGLRCAVQGATAAPAVLIRCVAEGF